MRWPVVVLPTVLARWTFGALFVLTPAHVVVAEATCAEESSVQKASSHTQQIEQPHATAQRKDAATLRACLVSAQSVLAALDQHVLVDIRSPMETARLRVPNALGLRLADIGDSPFLPRDGGGVVLMGDGTDTLRLLNACADARALGRPGLSVLAGGVRAWHRAGGQVVGDVALLQVPQVITTDVVGELVRLPGAWLVTDSVASFADVAIAELIDVAGLTPEAAVRSLKTRARIHPPLLIIAVLDPDADATAWQQAMVSASLPDPMFHTAGVAAYAEWSTRQTQMIEQSGRSLEAGCRWN